MLRSPTVHSARFVALALPLLAGCDLLMVPFDEVATSEPAALNLPRIARTHRAATEEAKVGPPDLTRIVRDPFLTAAEDEERRLAALPKTQVAVSRTRGSRPSGAAPVSAALEVIRRELSARVPLIIVGENGRNVAILADGTMLEEGRVIEGYYLVQKIDSDGIRIGSTDGKYRTRLPFAQSAPEGDRNPWDLKGRE